MHEVWSQELQCYRTRNVSLLRLKYTCFYLCSVTIVSGPIFRIFLLRPHAKTERKLNVSLADLIRCCPFTQGHSGVFRFLIVFIKKRYTHSFIIPLYSVGSSALKKAKRDGSLFKFSVEQFGNPSSTTSK